MGSSVYSSNNGTASIVLSDIIPSGGTNTYLVTYTFSATATGNYSDSFNPSVNLTGTNSNGPLQFTGSIQNSALLTVVGLTATPTRTPTATPTATPETVTLSSGSSSPSSSTKIPGAVGVPVLQIKADNSANSAAANVTNLKLTASGSGNSNSGISSVSLYLDANNDGVVDLGDTLLATGTYSSNTASLTFSNTIPAGGVANYLAVDNFSGSALAGIYQTSLLGNGDITAVNGSTGQAVLFTGAPVNGATITLANATPTVTKTPTITPSATSTITPTATATKDKDVKPVVYPNPSDGTKPVKVTVPYTDVKVQIFTTAFRKVAEKSFPPQSSGYVDLDLTDNWGTKLASGLYYVVVTSPNGKKVGKLLLER